jgi:hypothetical protein
LYGASWKLNSGITKISVSESEEDPELIYDIKGYSGSVYSCWGGRERMNGYMSDVYVGFEKQLESIGGTIKIIDIKDILKDYE